MLGEEFSGLTLCALQDECPTKTLQVFFFTTVHSSQHSHVLAVWELIVFHASRPTITDSDADPGIVLQVHKKKKKKRSNMRTKMAIMQ